MLAAEETPACAGREGHLAMDAVVVIDAARCGVGRAGDTARAFGFFRGLRREIRSRAPRRASSGRYMGDGCGSSRDALGLRAPASRGGTPDLATPVQAVTKSGVDVAPVREESHER